MQFDTRLRVFFQNRSWLLLGHYDRRESPKPREVANYPMGTNTQWLDRPDHWMAVWRSKEYGEMLRWMPFLDLWLMRLTLPKIQVSTFSEIKVDVELTQFYQKKYTKCYL